MHKSGFVNIIGNPNVGKSTLMNELIGEKLSIITSKAQTTRHRIKGIVNTEDYQIVFSDTPGILDPKYKLHEMMMSFVDMALKDADILMYITDVYENPEKHDLYLEKIKDVEYPILLVINKIDLSSQDKVAELVEFWKQKLPKAEIVVCSALNKFNTDQILNRIIELLPEAPPFFEKDDLTDKPMRFFISEIVREKILLYYQKEVPYSSEVVVEEFKESEGLVRIRAIINVIRQSQKAIIIGHKGEAIKKLGTEARKDIEAFLSKKVYLELFVKVTKDWRDTEKDLRRFGYQVN